MYIYVYVYTYIYYIKRIHVIPLSLSMSLSPNSHSTGETNTREQISGQIRPEGAKASTAQIHDVNLATYVHESLRVCPASWLTQKPVMTHI